MTITAKLNWKRKDETIVVILKTAVEMLYFEKLMHRHSEYESALDGYMHHVLNKPIKQAFWRISGMKKIKR